MCCHFSTGFELNLVKKKSLACSTLTRQTDRDKQTENKQTDKQTDRQTECNYSPYFFLLQLFVSFHVLSSVLLIICHSSLPLSIPKDQKHPNNMIHVHVYIKKNVSLRSDPTTYYNIRPFILFLFIFKCLPGRTVISCNSKMLSF